jgi:endonuclease III
MTTSNRQTLIAKVFKVLKNHYQPVKPPVERPVLEHLLYACCLENSHFEAADEGFARLQQSYFDWNEVRVTTVTELAETLACLADPSAAATRLKRCLQSVFETHYAFDLESLRKQNLGKAVKDIMTLSGTTPFTVAYVTQNGLGGHAIACSQGVIDAFEVLEIITPAKRRNVESPGWKGPSPNPKAPNWLRCCTSWARITSPHRSIQESAPYSPKSTPRLETACRPEWPEAKNRPRRQPYWRSARRRVNRPSNRSNPKPLGIRATSPRSPPRNSCPGKNLVDGPTRQYFEKKPKCTQPVISRAKYGRTFPLGWYQT